MYLLKDMEVSIKDINFELRKMHDLAKEQAQEIEDNELRIHNLKGKIEELENENKELKEEMKKALEIFNRRGWVIK